MEGYPLFVNDHLSYQYQQKVLQGTVKTILCGKDAGFNFDALSTFGDQKTEAEFNCKSHKIVMDMTSSRTGIQINGHSIQFPMITPSTDDKNKARLSMRYDVQEDGNIKVSVKLYHKSRDDLSEVRTSYQPITFPLDDTSQTLLKERSIKVTNKEIDLSDTGHYLGYKKLKLEDYNNNHNSVKRIIGEIIEGSTHTSDMATVKYPAKAFLEAAEFLVKKISRVKYDEIKPLKIELEQLINENREKGAPSALIGNKQKAINALDEKLLALYQQSDALKQSAFNEIVGGTGEDALAYCQMINLLHNKRQKTTDAYNKIDEMYPVDQKVLLGSDKNSEINQLLKLAIPLFSLGERDNPTVAMLYEGPIPAEMKYDPQRPNEVEGKAKFGPALNRHSAHLAQSFTFSDLPEGLSVSDFFDRNCEYGDRANLINQIAAIDAPRFWRRSPYWTSGRLISEGDIGFQKFGQPKPIQAAVEMIRSMSYATEGSAVRKLLDQTLVDLLKSKVTQGTINKKQLEQEIAAISEVDLCGDEKDSKSTPISLFTTVESLKAYLLHLVSQANIQFNADVSQPKITVAVESI